MESSKQTRMLMLLGTASALVCGAVFLYWGLRSQPATLPEGSDRDDEEGDDQGATAPKECKLSKQDAVSIFSEIAFKMEQFMMRLSKQEELIQKQCMAQGKRPDPRQLRIVFIEEFKKKLGAVEQETYAKYNTCEGDVIVASEVYKDVEELQVHVKRLEQFFLTLQGQTAATVPVPDWLTLEKTLTIMEALMGGSMIEAMEEAVEDLKTQGVKVAQGGAAGDEFNMKFHAVYAARVEKKRKQVFQEYKITQELLHAAVTKYQEDLTFKTHIEKLTMTQHASMQKSMQKLGLQPAGV